MKKLLTFLVVTCATVSLWAQDLPKRYASVGKLIIPELANAPFPHPSRAQGYTHKGKLFSAAEHYSDSRVAIFIPKGFRALDKVDFVVHFHGWNQDIDKSLARHQLITQFVESGRNAILLVPQGPVNASDSFGGKLDDAEGFARFMEETMSVLQKEGVFTKASIGKIILSGHSGGYQVMGSIVSRGGLTENIKEVWLFDALYARGEMFAGWQAQQKGRLVDFYTANGGTKKQSEDLMAELKKNNVSFYAGEETKTKVGDLMQQKPIFILSKLSHNEVLYQNQTFQHLLKTSVLNPIRRLHGVPSPRAS